MKKLILFVGLLLGTSVLNTFGQNLSYNKQYGGCQDYEAEKMLYQEINYYRQRNSQQSCVVTEKIVNYACRWGNYMVTKHVSPYDNFYQHSKYGPDSLKLPPNTCSEIIHVIYFDHKPSTLEIVNGLMYGVARSTGNVIGWTQSPGHNEALLQDFITTYGASIFVFKQKWWTVFGVVNFSHN